MAIYTLNAEHNGVEIRFTEKPAPEVLDALKSAGFRWHGKKKLWYAKQSPDRLALAEKLTGGTFDATATDAATETGEELIIPEVIQIDEGMYSGWKGGNYSKWNSRDELKKLLMADFKKAKIPATVRFRSRRGYSLALTVTIKITAADIIPVEEYKNVFTVSCACSNYYTNENGEIRQFRGKDYYNLSGEEQEKMLDNMARTEYKMTVDHLPDEGCGRGGRVDVLTDAANKTLATVRAIVDSYNKDQTNSMIDYFDRAIYDNYCFKIA